MAVAKAKAREAAKRGAKIWDCPYKAPSWRAVWLSEFERAQQMQLFN